MRFEAERTKTCRQDGRLDASRENDRRQSVFAAIDQRRFQLSSEAVARERRVHAHARDPGDHFGFLGLRAAESVHNGFAQPDAGFDAQRIGLHGDETEVPQGP